MQWFKRVAPSLLRDSPAIRTVAIFLTALSLWILPAFPKDRRYLELEILVKTVTGSALPEDLRLSVEVAPFPSGKSLAVNGKVSRFARPGVYVAKIEEAEKGQDGATRLDRGMWQVRIFSDLYEPHFLGPLRLKEVDHKIVPAESSEPLAATLVRRITEWRADFPLNLDLSQIYAFRSLVTLLEQSPRILLRLERRFRKPDFKPLDSLAGAKFARPDVEPSETLHRARAALLNIYQALRPPEDEGCRGTPDWTPYIQEIHVIGEERFMARVSPELFDRVQMLERQFPYFSCKSAFAASSVLHGFEDPLSGYWDPVKRVMSARTTASIKVPLCQGNVQITVGKFQQQGQAEEVLADFDLDEHLASLLHSTDVVRHHVTGRGTSAYEMGEMLSVRYRNWLIQQNQPVKPLELGYVLVPKNTPQNPRKLVVPRFQ